MAGKRSLVRLATVAQAKPMFTSLLLRLGCRTHASKYIDRPYIQLQVLVIIAIIAVVLKAAVSLSSPQHGDANTGISLRAPHCHR